MRTVSAISILLHLYLSSTLAAESPLKPCTLKAPFSGAFYDLNIITVQPLKDHKTAHKDDRKESWHARGYDYGTNFTLNFCAPVIESLDHVTGVSEALWGNVSAYYEKDGKTYSIGQASAEPMFRGRELVLNYTDGSPCEEPKSKRYVPRKLNDDDDPDDEKHNDDEDDDETDDDRADKGKEKGHTKPNGRTKSSLISLTCDREPLSAKAHLTFLGTMDECIYFFHAKSIAACGGITQETESTIGPGGVFGVIALITAAVYFLGGIAYQRTVMHQRGWRQLPNYAIWAGIGGFCYDILIILTSSCSRFLPRPKGYNQLPTSSRNGRGSRSEQENRLIDQLDEEWDD